jgi:hypothetical protein
MALVAPACGGGSSDAPTPVAPTPSSGSVPAPPVGAAPATSVGAAVSAMLPDLETQIASAIQSNESLIPRNPRLEALLRARVALLRDPALPARIRNETYYVSDSVASRYGRVVSLGAVFITADMRADAAADLTRLRQAVPVLEDFYAQAWPCETIREWYGFMLGNTGGGCSLWMEDRMTYEGRLTPTMVPYEPIAVHEAAHTYLSHEALNQFVELYGYNMVVTGSADVASWVFTRDYHAFSNGNTGVAALLDLYQVIGHDAMARAYRVIQPLHPPYGQVLSDACRQAFVDQAPESAKAQVSALVQRITY